MHCVIGAQPRRGDGSAVGGERSRELLREIEGREIRGDAVPAEQDDADRISAAVRAALGENIFAAQFKRGAELPETGRFRWAGTNPARSGN